MRDKDGLLAPERLDALARRDPGCVDLCPGLREHVRRRRHLSDKRGKSDDATDSGEADRSDIQEVAPADIGFALWEIFGGGA